MQAEIAFSHKFLILFSFPIAVSLPSGVQTEPQTILEKQNASLIAQIRATDLVVDAIISSDPSKVAGEPSSEEESDVSESDNEELNDVIEVKLPKKDDVKLEKSSIEFHRLSEDESDNEADKEIENILAKEIVQEKESTPEKSPAKELIDDFELKFEEQKLPETVPPISPSLPTRETIIDEDLLPKGPVEAPLSKNTDIDTGESHLEKQEDKPPIPLQTYLWEDVKRSKEQVSEDVCYPHQSPPHQFVMSVVDQELMEK